MTTEKFDDTPADSGKKNLSKRERILSSSQPITLKDQRQTKIN